MAAEQNRNERMEKIVSLCKRKGFIFQSAEIYGGLNGCWDYGPLGTELKRNLKNYWWQKNVIERDDIVGLDGSILTDQRVLEASGHIGGFSDPMRQCRHCKKFIRADQLEELYDETGWVQELADSFSGGVISTPQLLQWVKKVGRKRAKNLALVRNTEAVMSWLTERITASSSPPVEFRELLSFCATEQRDESGLQDPCPHCGGELTETKDFNLMFKTNMGATGEGVAYLRPETAQSIFVQFKNVCDQTGERVKIPFGIAQIGKAFRNEINPRNFTFRSREFEQMEIEFFCRAEDGPRLTDEWLETRLAFYVSIGIPREKLHVLDVPDGERAHYSSKTYDIEYDFPFGVQELEGVAYRTDHDLQAHSEACGKPQEYIDQAAGEKFIPHVVEPSAGCDRTVLALLCEAYDEETVTNDKGKEETRVLLRFDPKMAPIKCAVFPLLKNKPELVSKAKEVKALLSPLMNATYDETGAVGRRYRRQDEIGTPFCATIDFDTIGENGPELEGTVTVRERDSMQQERVKISELPAYIAARLV